MKTKSILLLLGLVLLVSACAHRSVSYKALPGISGMWPLDGRSLLTVHDKKHPDAPGSYLGVLELRCHASELFMAERSYNVPVFAYKPLAVSSRVMDVRSINDMEACCPLPGGAKAFLLAESGYYKGKGGRIFAARITPTGATGWRAEISRAFYSNLQELGPAPGVTPGYANIEGMACMERPDGTLILVLALRGGRKKGVEHPARLVWGRLDLQAPVPFERLGHADLRAHAPGCDRLCCDMVLIHGQKGYQVLAVAAMDKGNAGPFRSFIYRAGRFVLDKAVRYEPSEPLPLWTVDGVKVEALAPLGPGGSMYCAGSDDEDYGGLWRILPQADTPTH